MASTPKLTKVLVMQFTDPDKEKVRKFNLTNPRNDLTDQEVLEVMQTIERLSPFVALGRNPKLKSAQIVEKTTSNFGLTIG